MSTMCTDVHTKNILHAFLFEVLSTPAKAGVRGIARNGIGSNVSLI